jgi:hypothetical protein
MLMLGYHFYNRTIRNLTVAFGSLFTDMQISRFDNTNAVAQTVQVPISYAPAAKTIVRLVEQSSPDNDVQGKTNVKMVIPRMSYELSSMVFDAERARNRTQKMVLCDDGGRPTKWSYSRVPYNFTFTLNVLTRKTEDGLQIIEQIIPFFTPSMTIPINDMPELGLVTDIPIELTDIAFTDNYETEFQEQRELIWTLSFNVKAWLYFPVCEDITGLIETIFINYRPFEGLNDPSLIWETTVIRANQYGIYPELAHVNPNSTAVIDSVDTTKVLTSKWVMVVEDPKGEVLRENFQILATHNNTTAFMTKYQVMGDNTQHTLSIVKDGDVMKLVATNNNIIDLQFKFIRLDLEIV